MKQIYWEYQIIIGSSVKDLYSFLLL